MGLAGPFENVNLWALFIAKPKVNNVDVRIWTQAMTT
jgi:hypothetical protein